MCLKFVFTLKRDKLVLEIMEGIKKYLFYCFKIGVSVLTWFHKLIFWVSQKGWWNFTNYIEKVDKCSIAFLRIRRKWFEINIWMIIVNCREEHWSNMRENWDYWKLHKFLRKEWVEHSFVCLNSYIYIIVTLCVA